MSYFAYPNNDALEKLLAGIFPDIALSPAGVTLLAAQLRDLTKAPARFPGRGSSPEIRENRTGARPRS